MVCGGDRGEVTTPGCTRPGGMVAWRRTTIRAMSPRRRLPMAVFPDDPAVTTRLDYQLLQNGYIWLYHRREPLQTDLDWFRAQQYRVVPPEAAGWDTEDDFHVAVANALDFPSYYGAN